MDPDARASGNACDHQISLLLKGTNMELKDEIVINAPLERVYAALNDPEILRQCIPGCEELIQHSDTELEAKIVLKVGPVKARFSGNVQLDKSGAPTAFSLTGQGNGGAAIGKPPDPKHIKETGCEVLSKLC
jgi:hypothetical protein